MNGIIACYKYDVRKNVNVHSLQILQWAAYINIHANQLEKVDDRGQYAAPFAYKQHFLFILNFWCSSCCCYVLQSNVLFVNEMNHCLI